MKPKTLREQDLGRPLSPEFITIQGVRMLRVQCVQNILHINEGIRVNTLHRCSAGALIPASGNGDTVNARDLEQALQGWHLDGTTATWNRREWFRAWCPYHVENAL